MGSKTYYGLQDSGGNIIQKGWTSLPTLNLYGRNINSGQWYHCYLNSSLGIRLAYTTYSSTLGGPAWGNLPKGGTVSFAVNGGTYVFTAITGNITGFDVSLTRPLGLGDTVYQFDSTNTYTVVQYTVKDKYKVTVQKTNGSTTTTVSENEYEDGSNVTVQIPSGYTGYVLSAVSRDGASLSYSSVRNGYTISSISANVVLLYTFVKLNTITIKVGTGASGISATSTTTYTGSTSSKNISSGSGTITAQPGATITFGATAANGYVFHSSSGIVTSSANYSSFRGNGSASLANQTATAAGDATFTAQGQQFTITPSIVSHSDWGIAKIKESGSSTWSTGAIVLKPNTTYDLGFESSTESTYGATVQKWSIGGNDYSTSFTTGNQIVANLTAYLYLNQTKWYLSVANGTNPAWGTVSGDGWYPNGSTVNVVFTPKSSYSDIGIRANTINYNGSTTSCGNTATIVTTNSSKTATMYLVQTKFKMTLAFASASTSGWGSISSNKEYVGTGDVVRLSFAPTTSLVDTIHPVADHWTLLQQTANPVAASDGSSYIDVTLGNVSQDFTATCSLASSYRKVSIQRTDAGSAAWGNFYLGSSGTETEAYYPPGTQITMRFVRDANFDLKERPQVNSIAIGTESTINGVDGTYSYNYTLPANTKTDLTITGSVKQTAWPVTVNTDGNGSLMAKRMAIDGGSVIASVTSNGTAQTIYLRSGTTAEYLALTATANTHYGFQQWTKSNLSNYNSDTAKVQLSTAASASVSASFSRSDFKITCATDDAARADSYMQNDAQTESYFDKLITQNPVVICKIKSAYASDYKVSSWSIGNQHNITPQYNAQGDFYYVEVTSRTDVVVTAHIVRTSFLLTVNVGPNNYAQFGTVIVSGGGQQVKQFDTNGNTTYSCNVRENTDIEIVFYQKYGGRVLLIQPSSEIAQPSTTERAISFKMPSADCSVSFTLGEKEKYQLTVGVVNGTPGEEQNTPSILTVKSRTYSGIEIGKTDSTGVAKTFTVYKDEEYSIVATGVSDYMTRRYTMTGWKDESGSYIPNADTETINIIGTTTDARTRKIHYALRATGTVTIEYAKKENGVITPLASCPEGCSFSLLNTQDQTDPTHWLIGSDIKMPYVVMGVGFDQNDSAFKWTPIEVDVALATDAYSANATWDDGLLTQNGTFVMRGNMKVRVIFVLKEIPGYTAMSIGFKTGTTKLMGTVSLFATEMDAYTEDYTGARSLVRKSKKAVIMAAPCPGFAFSGWYTYANGTFTPVSGAKAVYEIAYVTSPATKYYAEFVASTVSNVKMWNGNPYAAKTFEWQSKVYVGAQFFKMQTVRVYSDGYPVTLKLFGSSSPDGIFGESARSVEITINGQGPRRLPKMRPEKYFAFRVSGYARINHVGIASSSGGLTA